MMNENLIKNRIYDIDVFKTRTFNESSINFYLFEKIIDNIDSLQEFIGLNFDSKSNEKLDWTGTKTILIETFNNRLKKPTVLYAPTNTSKQGRHFSKTHSLQGMARPIRHVLCKDNHIDIDMKNCHPVILKTLCQVYGFNCDKVNYYIDNRSTCLEELMTQTNKDKDTVKQWILSLLNGGNSSELFTHNISPWVQDFKNQIKLIHESFYNLPEFKYFTKQIIKQYNDVNVFNLKGKMMNKIFCMYENAIIQHVIHYFSENNIEVISNQFDGVLVKKNEKIDSLFLLSLSSFILEKVGFPIEFVIKDMNEGDLLFENIKNLKTNKEKKEELKNEKDKFKLEQKQLKQKQKDQEKQIKQKEKEDKKKDLPELCDQHIATYFLEKTDILLFHKPLMTYYIYNESRKLWITSPFENIASLLSHYILPYLDDLILNSDDVISIEKYEEYKINICNTKTQRDILFQIKILIEDNSDFINNNLNQISHLFPFGLEVFDFKTGSSRPREKEDYFTYTTSNKYKTNYDLDWIIKYEQEILMTEDINYINSFNTIISHCLTNDNSIKKIVALIGLTDSGKSAFLELLCSIFGKSHTKAPQRLFIKSKSESVLQSEMLPLLNKRCASISELEDSQEFNTSLLKNISGDDGKDTSIRTSSNSGYEEYCIRPKLWMITNEMPNSKDPALIARMLYIHFKNKFTKSEEKKKEIISHSDDFFSHLCNCASILVKNKYIFEPCFQMVEYKKEILSERPSSARDFLLSAIQFTENRNDRIKKADFYNKYVIWCGINSFEKDLIESRTDFFKECALDPFNISKNNKNIFLKTKGFEFFTTIKMVNNWNINREMLIPEEPDIIEDL